MNRYRRQDGVALIMVISMIAILLVVGAALAMVMANGKQATYSTTARSKAFNVAEAGLDMGMFSLSSTWPSSPPASNTAVTLSSDPRTQFSTSDFPTTSGRTFVSVTMSPGSDSSHLLLQSQANVAGKSVKLQTMIQQQNVGLTTLLPGFALYSGANTTMTGSQTVTSPLSNGVPTGGVYIHGNMTMTGSQNFSTVALKVLNTGTYTGSQSFSSIKTQNDSTVPTFATILPQSQISYLTTLSQTTPTTVPSGATVIAGGGTIPTSANAVHVTGNASLTGSGTYSITSLYVDGNLTITGSQTLNIGTLYVGGTLTQTGSQTFNIGSMYIGGSLNLTGSVALTNLGPTWVGGDATVTGSGTCKLPLLVAGGSITLTGSATWGGDGVGADLQPCIAVSLGSGGVTWTGSGPFYGLLAATTGGVSNTGSGNVYGSVLSDGAVNWTGSGQIVYNANVVNSIHTGSSTIAVLVPGTWEQVTTS